MHRGLPCRWPRERRRSRPSAASEPPVPGTGHRHRQSKQLAWLPPCTNDLHNTQSVTPMYSATSLLRKGTIRGSLKFFLVGVSMARMQSIVGVQGYIFHQIYAEQGKDHNEHWDEILSGLFSAGIEGYEQGLLSEDHARRLAKLLPKHSVKMQSIYAGGALLTPEWKSAVDT